MREFWVMIEFFPRVTELHRALAATDCIVEIYCVLKVCSLGYELQASENRFKKYFF